MSRTPTFVVIGQDGYGNPIKVPLQNTGQKDDQGNPLFAPAVAHSSQAVNATQTSTAAFVDVAGSTIDSLYNSVVSYTLLNQDGANGLSWQVLASNDAAFAASVTAQSSANIAAAGVGTYTTSPALYRYYKVQIKDQVGGSHAAGLLNGIARG